VYKLYIEHEKLKTQVRWFCWWADDIHYDYG